MAVNCKPMHKMLATCGCFSPLMHYIFLLFKNKPRNRDTPALTFGPPKEVEAKTINCATNCPSQDNAKSVNIIVSGSGPKINAG